MEVKAIKCSSFILAKYNLLQTLAHWGPHFRFLFEAIIKSLISKLSRSLIRNTPIAVYSCIIFVSMHSIFALPGSRHKCSLKKMRVSHFGLVFRWKDGDKQCRWEGKKKKGILFKHILRCASHSDRDELLTTIWWRIHPRIKDGYQKISNRGWHSNYLRIVASNVLVHYGIFDFLEMKQGLDCFAKKRVFYFYIEQLNLLLF